MTPETKSPEAEIWEPPAKIAPSPKPQRGLVSMFERLAKDPTVDVEKLQRLIDLQERILKHNAEAAFNAAFSAMQGDIPEIDEKGRLINHKTGQLQSTYAKNEDIQRALRPILQQHGFALSFRTEWPESGQVRLIGILTHREGHSRESVFLAAADDSGNKNAIQALGSTVSYGHRYVTADLLNITSRAQDDDGQASTLGVKKASELPAGFEDWWADMVAVSDDGLVALTKAWNESRPELRAYLNATNRQGWEVIKGKASKTK